MPSSYLPALDEFGDSAVPLDKLKRKERRTHIRQKEAGPGMWAPYNGPHQCVDRTGRVRNSHHWGVETRRGLSCTFCGRLHGGRADKERER